MATKKSPLKKTEIKEYQKRLEEMRRQLTSHLAVASADAKVFDESAGYSQHQADQGTDDFDKTISLELSSQDYKKLKLIDRALQKIAENSYGICDVSEQPIPKARLDAVPWATMTVAAQEQLERENG